MQSYVSKASVVKHEVTMNRTNKEPTFKANRNNNDRWVPLGPRVDAATGRVLGPDGTYWGKISVLRPGQRNECLSVYCGLHELVCQG